MKMRWVAEWTDDHEQGFNVLVPGLMGAGFLLSVLVLVVDWFSKKFPLSAHRRRVMEERSARGRVSDLAAVVDGRAPGPAQVLRVPRSPGRALILAFTALILAVVSAVAGIEAGIHVSPDRRAWVVGPLVALAVPLTIAGVVWVMTAFTVGRRPAWLVRANSVWPLGVYPDFDAKEVPS